MVAVTYGVARVATGKAGRKSGYKTASRAGSTQAAAPRKTWFARIMDALIEARMQQARREIRMHTNLLPYSFDERGNRLIKTETGNMPFGGW